MTQVAGPHPWEETCPCCEPVGTLGVVSYEDPRYLGGFVDAHGIRHDPLRHADDCPRMLQSLS